MFRRYSLSLLSDLFAMSLRLVFRNRRRYKGVMAAISAGAAGLVVVINLGDSVETKMGEHLSILGRSTIIDVEMVEANSQHPGHFSAEHADKLRKLPHVMEVAPHVSVDDIEANAYGETMLVRVAGVHPSFWNTIMARLDDGDLTDISHEKSRDSVCVLGRDVATHLFGATSPVGKTLQVGSVNCRVIGALGGIQSLSTRRTVFCPLATAQNRFEGMREIKSVRLRVDHWGRVKSVVDAVKEHFKEHVHPEIVQSVRVYYYPERIKKVENTVSVVKILAVLALTVTVIVGGVGTATLMLTAIMDRKREIGLKRALGAADEHIMLQFLMEAVVVCARAGIIGMLLGCVTSLILVVSLDLQVAPTVFALSVAAGLLGTIVLGILAGLYPAKIAIELDPVVSMRLD